jgi:hypothetical protein
MAEQQCSTPSLEIIKITAAQLRAGRRVLICVLNDSIDSNLKGHIESSIDYELSKKNGDFWVSFGSFENEN